VRSSVFESNALLQSLFVIFHLCVHYPSSSTEHPFSMFQQLRQNCLEIYLLWSDRNQATFIVKRKYQPYYRAKIDDKLNNYVSAVFIVFTDGRPRLHPVENRLRCQRKLLDVRPDQISSIPTRHHGHPHDDRHFLQHLRLLFRAQFGSLQGRRRDSDRPQCGRRWITDDVKCTVTPFQIWHTFSTPKKINPLL